MAHHKTLIFAGLFALPLFGALQLSAQSAHQRFSLESGVGFIIPHSKAIAEVSNYRPLSIQMNYSKILTSEKSWQVCYCTPIVGLISFYHRYGNPTILGIGAGAMAMVQPMFGLNKTWSYGLRLAGGPVYLNKVFHPEQNPDNLFFSSTVSAILQGGFELHYRMQDRWGIYGHAVYNHISNGGLKEPNKGMNYPTILLGIAFYPKGLLSIPTYPYNRSWENEQPWSAGLGVLYSARSTGDLYAKRLHVYGIDASVHYRHGILGESRLGVEWVADAKRSRNAQERGGQLSEHHLGIHAGEYLMAGKFSLGLAIGAYIWNRDPSKDPVYQRYQLSTDIHKNIRLSLTLRVHRSVADFADLRLTYLF